MSGTSYGTCILHVSPESAVGGPLALVRDGDLIELDVKSRRLELHVSEGELTRRRGEWKAAGREIQPRIRAAFLCGNHAGARGLRLQIPARGKAHAESRIFFERVASDAQFI